MAIVANENEQNGRRRTDNEPDAHGQAALMLAESILHTLIETDAFSVPQAIDVVRSAEEMKGELAVAIGESPSHLRASLRLLERIAISLEADA